jgi:hypothetical protein
LNQINVCRFTQLTPTYGLIIEPYWRLDDVNIAIFKYTGVNTDTITEQLDRIEADIDLLLARTGN